MDSDSDFDSDSGTPANGESVADNARKLKTLLDTDPPESEMQRFFEQYPYLLDYNTGGGAVITQLPLGSDYRCDFAWTYRSSQGVFLTLVEIESPRMQIFNKADEFTQKFNHAVQQLRDWGYWVDTHADSIREIMRPFYDQNMTYRISTLTLHLIAGRRSQLSNATRKRRWEGHAIQPFPHGHINIRTYDGIYESWTERRFEKAFWRIPSVVSYSEVRDR
jgi:hypothetical protein